MSTYNEIIKSATILEPVTQKLDLEITIENLLKNITAFQVNDTEIIKISVENEDLALVCDIVNTITSVFSKEIYRIMIVDSISTLDVASYQMENELVIHSMK